MDKLTIYMKIVKNDNSKHEHQESDMLFIHPPRGNFVEITNIFQEKNKETEHKLTNIEKIYVYYDMNNYEYHFSFYLHEILYYINSYNEFSDLENSKFKNLRIYEATFNNQKTLWKQVDVEKQLTKSGYLYLYLTNIKEKRISWDKMPDSIKIFNPFDERNRINLEYLMTHDGYYVCQLDNYYIFSFLLEGIYNYIMSSNIDFAKYNVFDVYMNFNKWEKINLLPNYFQNSNFSLFSLTDEKNTYGYDLSKNNVLCDRGYSIPKKFSCLIDGKTYNFDLDVGMILDFVKALKKLNLSITLYSFEASFIDKKIIYKHIKLEEGEKIEVGRKYPYFNSTFDYDDIEEGVNFDDEFDW